MPKMCLLRKITYGEFSEFIREKKIHIKYLHTYLPDLVLIQSLIFCCIFWNCSFVKNKILEKFPDLEKPGTQQLYGLFAEITLVENEQCNLTADTCSKFDSFLSLPYRSSRNRIKRSYAGYYANGYKRQGENSFSFSDPSCNRRC